MSRWRNPRGFCHKPFSCDILLLLPNGVLPRLRITVYTHTLVNAPAHFLAYSSDLTVTITMASV